jgi:hypothetical protein
MNESVQIFGDYEGIVPIQGESLSMVFSPSNLPLKRRWENNGLSADFIADYFKNFYVSRREEVGECDVDYTADNLRDAVKYIANELLENAMKFQDPSLPFTAQIVLLLHSDRLVFHIVNGIKQAQAEEFLSYIKKLLESDPHELYISAMRNSAKDENKGRSGLGLLSMICDYSAKLGWKFEFNPDDEVTAIVSTMVTLQT